jgi:dynein intermediate chain 2
MVWDSDVCCDAHLPSLDVLQVEHVIRYKKKVEKDEDYVRSIKALGDTVVHLLKQNCAIDIYEEYFANSTEDHSSEPPSAKTLTVFRDPNAIKRTATSISWYPDGAKKVAVSYAILDFQKVPDGMSLSSYIWDVQNPNYPEMEMIPSSPLCVVEYNPKDPHFIIGGCYNGQIAIWDDRKGSQPAEVSPIEKSHRDPVYDVAWLQSKSGTEVASVSTDGQLFTWDTRKTHEPFESLILDVKNDGMVWGGTTLAYEQAAGPTKILVGTEQGSVLLCNRKSKSPSDRISAVYPGHHGPVYALQRNPTQHKYFLTIGDWTARIWAEDLRTPIMCTKYHASCLTDGCWSPVRPGVFFTTKMDGTLDIWDFFYKQNDPIFQLQVTDVGLHTMSVESNGKTIAAGAMDGSTTLLEICDGLSVTQPAEKTAMAQMFERETRREKNLEARAKELRLKEKKDAAKGSKAVESNDDEEKLRQVEEEFFSVISKAESMQDHGNEDISVPMDM